MAQNEMEKERKGVQKEGLSPVGLFYMSSRQVADLFGWNIKTAQRHLREIRTKYGLEPQARVTNEKFAEFNGFSMEFIKVFKEGLVDK